MSHRRIYQSTDHWLVRELGSGRDLCRVPINQLFESLKPAQQIAKEIKAVPEMISYLQHRAFHGCDEAKKLLEGLK